MKIFNDFHSSDIANKAMNNTYIALIVEKGKCSLASDYKPISLTTAYTRLLLKF